MANLGVLGTFLKLPINLSTNYQKVKKFGVTKLPITKKGGKKNEYNKLNSTWATRKAS